MSMPRRSFLLLAATATFPATARAQLAAEPLSVASLRQMDEAQLQAVYRQGTVAGLPPGRMRGTPLPAPGTRRNAAMSTVGRLVWQGKVIDSSGTIAVNRFFGVQAIKGRLYQGQSWLDGGPALILDYADTSRLYADNRDEIRLIAPGLYLGLMHDRSTNPPTLTTYFVIETTD
jgi:hypothetical protein